MHRILSPALLIFLGACASAPSQGTDVESRYGPKTNDWMLGMAGAHKLFQRNLECSGRHRFPESALEHTYVICRSTWEARLHCGAFVQKI